MQDFSVENPIALCTKKCAEMRSNMVLIAGVIGIVVIAVVVVVAAVVAVTAGVKDTLKDDE